MSADFFLTIDSCYVLCSFDSFVFYSIVDFKPKLERLLKEICLLAEIAEVADQAEEMARADPLYFVDMSGDERESTAEAFRPEYITSSKNLLQQAVNTVNWIPENQSVDKEHLPGMEHDEGHFGVLPPKDDSLPSATTASPLKRDVNDSLRIKRFLDRWEEPISKADKSFEATIRDVLHFRQILELVDESHPFGDSFGNASSRDQCIISSHQVYSRLLKMTPSEHKVPFESLSIVAPVENDGVEQLAKQEALLKFLRPDRDGKVPLLAFVQACDSLYRRLRYFRASVGNSTVIDRVLENVFDTIFGFVLLLLILAILRFNPYVYDEFRVSHAAEYLILFIVFFFSVGPFWCQCQR